MISINATIVLQVVHFLILAFILNRLMFQPILKLIRERAAYIEKTKNDTKNLEDESNRLQHDYLAREKGERNRATLKRSQLRGEGMIEAEKYLSKSREEVVSLRKEAEEKAKRESEKTRPSLEHEAAVLAEDIIERLIGRRIAG